MARVSFEGVSKVFDDGAKVVDGLDLAIEDGEFLVLVGPSGCGKTTSLRMLAGLEDLSEGTIRIGDRVVNDVPTKHRDIAMVFQNYSLYPHMTVRQNMGFGLRVRKSPPQTIATKVERVARMLDLEALLDRLPRQLSGGQRQRVAMGRSIVREPQAFLMDEPLSNLDAKLRLQMRAQIARLQRRLGVTTIYVTHDQVEAMTMGDRVAVRHAGVLQQVAAPGDLYARPRNLFVAGFIGAPPMNLVQTAFDLVDGEGRFRFGSHEIRVPGSYVASRPALAAAAGSTIALGVRPEDIDDVTFARGPKASIRAPVELVEHLGSDTLAHIAVDAQGISAGSSSKVKADPGARAAEHRAPGTTFIARCDPRTLLDRGQTADFAVDVERMHTFDLVTGEAL